jgi:predicted Zn-dependent protease with MMP-like domain
VAGIDVPSERFAELVAEALDEIPEELGRLMDNVNVFVDDASPPGRLFGLYEGIPLTRREAYGGLVMPDRITIFRRTICARCGSEDEVRRQVQVTVVHEVAHHFGIGDARLHELGWG